MPPSSQDPARWESQIPNRLGALMRALEELDQCCERWGLDPQSRYLAQLAVEELGTNIIKYGYDDPGEHRIQISAEPGPEGLLLRLEDDGHEFNPWAAPEPDPDLSLQERRPGGWGLSLVRRLLTGLDYARREGRNRVQLVVPHQAAVPPD